MKPLSLGLLAWDYPPSASGLSVAAREIAESLVEAGHDVRVFALDRTDASTIDGVDVIGCRLGETSMLAKLRRFGSVGHLAAPLAFATAVRKAHHRRPFDLVEATNWYAPAALLHRFTAIPVVTRNSTPVALTENDSSSAVVSRRDRLDRRFAARLEAYSAKASAGLISNTRAHGETIGNLYGLPADKRVESPSGRHAVVGLSLPQAKAVRGRLSTYPSQDAPFKLLFVGRAERRKGFDLLMGALERLADKPYEPMPAFELRVVGVKDSDLPELSPAAQNALTLTGRLDEQALESEYEACHGVIAPSRYESFGLVYQEALAFGRPVVALAEDASAVEFIGKTGAGLLAEVSTPDALAQEIAELLRSEDRRRALREAALRAAGRFDRTSLATQTLTLYRTALGLAPDGAD